MNDSSDKNICPQCGEEIPPDAPGGLCPRCLYAAAINPVENEPGIPRETNLLFGILGIQLRVFNVNDFIDAAAAWVTDPTVGVPERLRNSGVIDQGQVDFLDGLVKQAIEHHHGDADETLTALNGDMTLSFVLSAATDQEAAEHLKTELGLPPIIEDVQLDEAVSLREEPGRYTRTTPYSRGGMGQIYLVHDEFLNRDVALKELLPFGSDSRTPITPVRQSSNMTARFLREAKLTGQLEHPSIVPVYEMGRREDGSLYYTMKLIRGRTFTEQLKRSEQVDDRLNVLPHFVDLCNAVAYAHSRGVIHRDIKPSNVLIGAFGETVVIDWGLAKVIGQPDPFEKELLETISRVRPIEPQSGSNTQTGEVLGTPSYMSPEQTRGEIDRIDTRSDVFSLGIFLYEILCGQLPFVGADSGEVYDAIREANPIPIQQHEPRIPPELASICMKALAPDSKDRFQNAAELRDELIQFQTGALVGAYDYSSFELLKRYYRQHRTALNTAAAAAAILLVMGVWSFMSIRKSRDEAIRERYVSDIQLVNEYVVRGDFGRAQELIWQVPIIDRHWEWGYSMNAAYHEFPRFDGRDLGSFSPDGERIAIGSRVHSLSVHQASNGRTLNEINTVGQYYLSLQFSNDGSRILSTTRFQGANEYDVATGELRGALDAAGETVHFGVYSRDGTMTATHNGVFASLWDAETRQRLFLLGGHTALISGLRFSRNSEYLVTWAAKADDEDGNSVGEVIVWDTSNGEVVLRNAGLHASVSPDSDTVAISRGNGLTVLDLASGSEIGSFEHVNGKVEMSLYLPGESRVVSLCADGYARVWGIGAGPNEDDKPIPLYTLRHGLGLTKGAVSDDGALLATMSFDGQLLIWDMRTGRRVRSMQGLGPGLRFVQFHPDNRRILIAKLGGKVVVRNAAIPPGQQRLANFRQGVHWISEPTIDGKIAVHSGSNAMYILDPSSGEFTFGIEGFGGGELSYPSIDATGRRIAIALDGRLPMVFDIPSRSIVATLCGHSGRILQSAISQAGNVVATAGWDRSVRVWNVSSEEEFWRWSGFEQAVTSVAFADEDRKIIAGSLDGTVRCFDAETGDVVWQLLVAEEMLDLETNRIAIPPKRNGTDTQVLRLFTNRSQSRIAAVCSDSSIRVYDAVTGDTIFSLLGHREPPEGICFSADDERILSTSGDGYLRIWHGKTGRQLLSIPTDSAGLSLGFTESNFELLHGYSNGFLDKRIAGPWKTESALRREDFESGIGSSVIPFVERKDRPVANVFVTSIELFQLAMERITEIPSQPPTPGENETSGALASAGKLFRVGLQEDDRIRLLDGMVTDTLQELRLAAVAATEKLSAVQNNLAVDLEFERGNVVRRVRYLLVRTMEPQHVIDVEAIDALAYHESALDAVRKFRENIFRSNKRFAELQGDLRSGTGIPDADGTLAGFWLTLDDTTPRLSDLVYEMGLSHTDHVLSIDDVEITDLNLLEEHHEQAIASLRTGGGYDAHWRIERGEFQNISLRIRTPNTTN